MINIKKITKHFGDFVAVNNLSFQIQPGEVVGFLGPNGAGKSTTMKMITGFLEPTDGEIEIAGLNFSDDEQALEIKRKLGYLPEGAPAYGDMTVAQFLNFIADIRGLSGDDKTSRLQQVIASVELQSVLGKNIDNLSKGFKRRVGLAQAIIHDPDVLILDEPTDGLDPNQKHQVRELIKSLAKDKIVIVSTHILEEVTAVCNRAIIIANGSKIFDGTPQELQAKSSYHHAVTIELTEPVTNADELKAITQVSEVNVDGNQITLKTNGDKQMFSAVYEKVHELGWQFDAIYSEKGRLDDIFRELTQ